MTGNTAKTRCLLADHGSHGQHATGIGARLFSLQSQRAAPEYLPGLACAKSGLHKDCSSPWGTGCPLWSGQSHPVPCRESAAGRVPTSPGNQGLPARLFRSTVAAEGDICLPACPQGPGHLFQACQGPEGQKPTTGFAREQSPAQELSGATSAGAVAAPKAHQQLLSSQMLLTFATSERKCVQERAVGRIEKMSSALFRHPTLASCARYLRTSERTDVLVFIEVMRHTSIFDKKRATDLLDMVMEFPDFWLADVSGQWLGCPTRLQPCQALFLPPSLPPNPWCLRNVKPHEGGREEWEGQLRKWLHSRDSAILTCISSSCQRS
ncbi:uncharacterized protein LOC135578044 [Columba livia]|uniref:uncharacterized protein LOC135578044 n=1 Tax=Columba livia TaxID=8932 RepID=UPI0031B9AF0F